MVFSQFGDKLHYSFFILSSPCLPISWSSLLPVPPSPSPLVLNSPHPPSAPSPQGEGLSNLALVHLLNILLVFPSPSPPVSLSPCLLVSLSPCQPDRATNFLLSPSLPVSKSPCQPDCATNLRSRKLVLRILLHQTPVCRKYIGS
ncbi:MAG: hypothetical protein FD170_2477 [Bacteroidetes bacterium]|nr:MAG: hypothetical protein FD170_2477 [Bacteroidota bacterium]